MTKFIVEKPRADSEFMSPNEALRALDKAGRLHNGEIKLPQNIIDLKKLIAEKTRNAELFVSRVGAIDEGMLQEITDLRLRLDGLYAKWGLE